jgi:hypothetical protein
MRMVLLLGTEAHNRIRFLLWHKNYSRLKPLELGSEPQGWTVVQHQNEQPGVVQWFEEHTAGRLAAVAEEPSPHCQQHLELLDLSRQLGLAPP